MTEKELEEIYDRLLELDGRKGLPEKVFLAVSSILPIANVDLLILDDENRVLLSWRDDKYFGQGWHLPGGCLRFKETMLERVQKTALAELGTEVEVKPTPLAVRDVILGKGEDMPRLRAHHLAVLYECRLTHAVHTEQQESKEYEAGSLKWFAQLPPEFLSVHDVYNDIFAEYGLLKDGVRPGEATVQG